VRLYIAFRCVRVTVVAVEKHNYYILCVCVCVCILASVIGLANSTFSTPHCICTCGLSSYTI
jgi:hypothetical protein